MSSSAETEGKRVWWAILMERGTTDTLEQYHLNVAMRAGSLHGYTRLAIPYGRTDAVRNLAARSFMRLSRNPNDTLIMLDQDHAHPDNILERLAATDVPVVGALAFQRGAPYGPCFYALHPSGQLRQVARWDAGGLYPCAAIGHAAIAIQRRAFEAIWRNGSKYPWWRYLYPYTADLVEQDGRLLVEPDRDPITLPSEDIYFSRQVTEAGLTIYCDTAIICPHKIDGGWVDETSFRDYLADHAELETQNVLIGEAGALELAAEATPPAAERVSLPAAPRTAKVDIIIPGWNNFDLTDALLQSLAQTEGVYFRIIYVDNGSDPAELAKFKISYPSLIYVELPENVGFVAAINAGLAQAALTNAPYVLWLNNDVTVPEGDTEWLARLLAGFDDHQVGAVGAVSDNVYGYQRRPAGTNRSLVFTETPVLIGFALAIRRTAAQAVGSLDPAFGFGNYEDWDYSIRLRQAGWTLQVAEGVFLEHRMHASFEKLDQDFNGLLDRNRAYLVQKWGADVLADMGINMTATVPGDPAALARQAQEAAAKYRSNASFPAVNGPGLAAAGEAVRAAVLTSETAYKAAEADSASGQAMVRIVTHATVGWLPNVLPYLDSLHEHGPWPVDLLVVRGPGDRSDRAPETSHGARWTYIEDQAGAPEGTHSLQHGAFESFVTGHPEDVLVYTDGDIRLQRAPSKSDMELLAELEHNEVAAGWNSAPYETLALEATRLQPRIPDLAQVFDGETLATASCYNIGVIAARRSTWRTIHREYMTLYPAATRSLNHRARQQWLVCYVIAKLSLSVVVLPRYFHMHGCYTLPEGGKAGLVATYNGVPVLFRHHIP